jgi:hypothetical protein
MSKNEINEDDRTEAEKAARRAWQKSYDTAWNKLFRALPEDEQEQVKAAPGGEQSAELGLAAYEATSKKVQIVFVLVKNSREYSSGQLEHLAEYFFDRAEADEACERKNAKELTQYCYGLGIDEEQAEDRGFCGSWLVVEEIHNSVARNKTT